MRKSDLNVILALLLMLIIFSDSQGQVIKDKIFGRGLKISFRTVTDIDGNIYKTVKIGTQTWMAENLRVGTLNNKESIHYNNPYIIFDWYATYTIPAYGFIEAYKSIYGYIYNLSAVKSNKLCPLGWHVPSKDEWYTLVYYLGGISIAGGKLKEAGTSHWHSRNYGATNESGFTALPSGVSGCTEFGYTGVWWTTGDPGFYYQPCFFLQWDAVGIGILTVPPSTGQSVRCLKD